MAVLALKLTDAGLAAVQGASGSDPVLITELGLTETVFDYAPTLTALPGEFKRLEVMSGTAAAPNITHLTAYDASSDVWTASGTGLFLSDGTLFGVCTSEEPLLTKSAAAFALWAFDIAFEADFAASIAFGDATFIYPPATETTRGVARIATLALAQAGADDETFLTPAKAKASVSDWLEDRDEDAPSVDADLLSGKSGRWYVPAGMIGDFPFRNAPAGWTAADGKSIGSPASGAVLASNDAADLFVALWNDVVWTIQTSTGATSARGASAAADWAANKRILIPDYRAEFRRGWDNGRGIDAGRAFGSLQASQNAEHAHGVTDPGHTHGGSVVGGLTGGSGASYLEEGQAAPNYVFGSIAGANTGISIQTSGGAEARPRNAAVLVCLKL